MLEESGRRRGGGGDGIAFKKAGQLAMAVSWLRTCCAKIADQTSAGQSCVDTSNCLPYTRLQSSAKQHPRPGNKTGNIAGTHLKTVQQDGNDDVEQKNTLQRLRRRRAENGIKSKQVFV